MAKVMVVDDSLFMRNHLTKSLTKHGYEIIAVEDGEQAVLNYRQTRPDAVLMDITMPRKDGLQALTEIRDFDSRDKVIMLTALDQELAATRAIHLGARDFLVKPASSNGCSQHYEMCWDETGESSCSRPGGGRLGLYAPHPGQAPRPRPGLQLATDGDIAVALAG